MEPPKEITTTKQRADGIRTFAATLGAHHTIKVEVKVSEFRDTALPDEPITLHKSDEPVSNKDLAIALIRIASASITRVGSSL